MSQIPVNKLTHIMPHIVFVNWHLLCPYSIQAQGSPNKNTASVSLHYGIQFYHQFYYREKLRAARYCHGMLSVCPSVCPSVTLRYRDHIRSNSAKIISRLISLTISLSADPNMTDLLQREHPQILAGIGVGWAKFSIFDV